MNFMNDKVSIPHQHRWDMWRLPRRERRGLDVQEVLFAMICHTIDSARFRSPDLERSTESSF